MGNLILSEKEHIVLQGEGPHIGQKMVLFRVLGCPIKCEKCDSAFTWQNLGQEVQYSIDEFYAIIKDFQKRYGIKRVMVTGGEPVLYKTFFEAYFEKYENDYIEFEFETSGYGDWAILRKWWPRIQFNFSPKIGSLKGTVHTIWAAFDNLPHNYSLKVVVSKSTIDQDLQELTAFKKQYSIANNYIYLMPLGTTRDEMVEQSAFVLEKSLENNYNFSPRLHVFIYDDKRMV
jgi:7-carboxy-7-deazaguanine synthase